MEGHAALTYSAVFSIPSLGAHARAVVTFSVEITAVVTLELVTEGAGPAGVTHTPLALALAVSTFQSADL